MRRQFLFGTVFAAAMAVGLSAQSTSQAGMTSQSDRGQSVTVTGCLQNADSSPSSTGTSGTGSSAATAGTETGSAASAAGSMSTSADKFVLTDVSMGSSSTTGETTTSPQTPTGTSGSTAALEGSSLLLSAPGSKTSEWSKYVNHRVEIRGTLDKKEGESPSSYSSNPSNPTSTNPSNPTSTNPTGTSGSTAGTMTGSSASNPSASAQNSQDTKGTLHVTSIRDLGTSCSSK